MPSNTMKISQLIKQLQGELETHGDLDCVLQVSELGAPVALDGRNIVAAVDLPGGKLPAPALVFGIWIGERGAPTNSPGQKYQVTNDGRTDWDHDLRAAPDDKTPLIVWKRYLGEDRGYREGDNWFVYEGGDKPIQIIPAGILGWRLAPVRVEPVGSPQ